MKILKMTKKVFELLQDPYERSFYLTLLYLADENNEVNVSNNDLANFACMSLSKIKRVKKELSEKIFNDVGPAIEVFTNKDADGLSHPSVIRILL